MKTDRTTTPTRAFTLVELLVVMAIIGILVAVLLPAVGAVRTSARVTQASSQLAALEAGLESFRSEQNLGGTYPPSTGDDPDVTKRHKIADPTLEGGGGGPNTEIAGAHLLLHAMLGADLLGPPGFVDTNHNGAWSDDTHLGIGGAYDLDDTTAEPLRIRYGGAGFVSDKMKARVKTLGELQDSGIILDSWEPATTATLKQYLFVDPWDHPILYYKANKAARYVTVGTGTDAVGVYRQEDNGIITGSEGGALTTFGADFGAGADEHDQPHWIHKTLTPPLKVELDGTAGNVNAILTSADYEHSFARYILDRKSRGRNQPVRKDSYLLIGAGPDGIYGSLDDVTNWEREQE